MSLLQHSLTFSCKCLCCLCHISQVFPACTSGRDVLTDSCSMKGNCWDKLFISNGIFWLWFGSFCKISVDRAGMGCLWTQLLLNLTNVFHVNKISSFLKKIKWGQQRSEFLLACKWKQDSVPVRKNLLEKILTLFWQLQYKSWPGVQRGLLGYSVQVPLYWTHLQEKISFNKSLLRSVNDLSSFLSFLHSFCYKHPFHSAFSSVPSLLLCVRNQHGANTPLCRAVRMAGKPKRQEANTLAEVSSYYNGKTCLHWKGNHPFIQAS